MKQTPDKSDWTDAKLLADLSWVGYVPRVWLAPEHIRDLRALVRHRHRLVEQRKQTKLRLRAALRNHRIVCPHSPWTVKGKNGLLDPEIKPEILTVRIEQGSIGQGIRKTQNIPKRVDELVCYLGDLNVCSKQVGAADPFFLEVSKLGLPTGTLGEKNGKLGLFVIFRNNFTGFHRRWNEVGFWGIYSYCGCFVFVNEVKKRLFTQFSRQSPT